MISKLNRRLRVMATVVAVVWAWTAMAQADASVINKVAQRFSFTGYAQAGWEYHDQSDPNNEFSINKIILMSNFKVTDEVNAFAMFDFKGFTLHELWVNYRVKPWLQVKLGQFKTPFSIENPLSPASLEMITQTSLVTNHMICGASPTMMPAGAGRDMGLNVGGDAGTWLTYDLAVMNGAGRNKRDDNSWKDFVARLTLHPVQVLDVSASAVLGKGATKSLGEGMAAAVWRDEAVKNDYVRNRFAAGASLRTRVADARAEWMWGKDGRLKSNGCYATTQVKNVAVRGLDVVASFDHLDTGLDITNRYQAGVQYWFYKKCRAQAGYAYTKQHGSAGENAILTQVQVAF